MRKERAVTDKAELFASCWRMLAPPGLQDVWQTEYKFALAWRRKFRFDFANPARKIAVEIDGGQWQARGGRHARDTDREKMNIAAALGWRVFHFSPDMLGDNPLGCVSLVVECLR